MPGVAVPDTITPSAASTALITSSTSIGSGDRARSPATVSTVTFWLIVLTLPAGSVVVALSTAPYSPFAMLLAGKVAVQLPAASTVAVTTAPPSCSVTPDPGSVVPVTVKPPSTSGPDSTPSPAAGVSEKPKSRTPVSTVTVPVEEDTLPAASVAVAVTVASYSPAGIALAGKSTVQLPAASTVAGRLVAPNATKTVEPGCVVPVKVTPLAASGPFTTPSVSTLARSAVTLPTVSMAIVSLSDVLLPAASTAVTVIGASYSPGVMALAGMSRLQLPSAATVAG